MKEPKDGVKRIYYFYDALGRRVRSINYDETSNDVGGKIFINSGDRLLEEYTSDNGFTDYSVSCRYLYGSDYPDDVAAIIVGSRTMRYLHQDRQFNVVGISDHKRRLIEYTHYAPYGERSVTTRWQGDGYNESQCDVNIGFTGRYYDSLTGLYYFRARYYDEDQGRFISRDPSGYVDGMGLYNGYFASRFAMDPTGEFGIFGAIANVVADIAISKLTGEKYSVWDAAKGAVLGAAGLGAVNKLRKLNKIRKAHKAARKARKAEEKAMKQAKKSKRRSGKSTRKKNIDDVKNSKKQKSKAKSVDGKPVKSTTEGTSKSLKRKGIKEVKTNETVDSFREKIQRRRYKKGTHSDGTEKYSKGDTTYTIYDSKTGPKTVQRDVNKRRTHKIRLEEEL